MAYHDYRVSEETDKTIWNMDDAILKTIHNLKVAFILYLHRGDLENSYWIIRQIRMEVESKLKDDEQKELKKDLNNLEKKRVTFAKDDKNYLKRSDYYIALEDVYMELNKYMKKYGLFFREVVDTDGDL